MQRRVFVTGSLLAAAAAATSTWRAKIGAPGAASARRTPGAEPLPDGRVLVRDAALAFGTTVSMAVVHDDPEIARAAAMEALAEVRRIDALMTVYRPESQVGRLNADGELARPDPHLVHVLEFAQRLAARSNGAFDVTVQPLWLLYSDCKRRGLLPTPAEVAAARARVDWTALEVSRRRIALGRPGMAITLNGIAQGYAADLALAALRARGVEDALVDTGEYGSAGAPEPGRPWTIGIQHPRRAGAVIAALELDGRFVATSGDYASTFSEDFMYNHIFDPHSGDSPRRLSSVVVAAVSGMVADALTKPVMILDQERAEALLSEFPGAGAVWIDKDSRIAAARGMKLVAT